MALALDAPFAAAPPRVALRTGAFAVPALASLGAGAIHATAVGAHAGARQTVITFAVTAAVQLGLGAIALVSSRKLVGIALAAGNLGALAGWAMAKRSGISFIDGMETAESVQWADGLAAAMAAITVLAVAVAALRSWRFPASHALVRVLALPVAAITISGMIAAGSHAHAGGHDEGAAGDGHAHDEASVAAGVEEHAVSAVPGKPFIPGEPIDLGGVPGVTPAQQADAENILAATLYYLPRWSDYRVAEAEGWRSIGDGATGHEHFVNGSTYNDGKILDPTAPESLVYTRVNGERVLQAAMFQLPTGSTMADVPDTGGALMQWHIHDNLCFRDGRVAGLRSPGAPCTNGTVIGGEEPMIHVWITSHPCGPFAALDGLGAGTIAEGETRLCDTAHGH